MRTLQRIGSGKLSIFGAVFSPVLGYSMTFMLLTPQSGITQNMVHVYPDEFRHRVGSEFSGVNVVYVWETDDSWANKGIASNLTAMGTSFIRYPGGEVTDYYHWENPNGFGFSDDTWDPAWDPANAVDGTNWMSLAEYIGHVDAIGAQPLLGINIDSGHVYNRTQDGIDEAVDFVRHALTNGYAVKHWFIGNESYHPSSRSPAGAGEPMMSVTEYANYINQYADAIRAVDSEIEIIANWANSWSSSYETLLNIAGDNIDMLDIHCYWNWDAASWTNWIDELPMQHKDLSYADKFQQFRQNLDSLGYERIKVGMLEYNLGDVYWEDRPGYFQTGLMNSEIMFQAIEGGIDAACFWTLTTLPYNHAWKRNALLSHIEKFPQPSYYALQLFTPVAGHHCINSADNYSRTFTTATLSPTEDLLTVYILRKAQWTAPIELNTHGFSPDEVLVETLQGYNSDVESDYAEIITPAYTTLANGNISFTVPPWSLTRVSLMKSTHKIESGTVTANSTGSDDWRSVSFTNTFSVPPVVICSPLSCNLTDPALLRVRNVNTNGFEYRVSEWNYQDNVHGSETFHWVAVPEGVHLINGSIWEAGFVESNSQWNKAHRFKHKFSNAPFVFTQVYQPENLPVAVRVKNRQQDRFEIRLDQEEAESGDHAYEKVGYLAVPWTSPAANLNSGVYKVVSTGHNVTHDWKTKNFGETLSNPRFIAGMQGEQSGSDPFVLRYKDLTPTGLKIKVEEETSADAEQSHYVAEDIAILVIGD